MTHVIYFDNTNVSENFAETKEYLQDACGGAVTDEQVWDELSVIERTNWEECLSILKELFAKRRCIAYGTIGTWMGKREGAKMFNDVEHAIDAIVKDCDYITIESGDEDTIKVSATHHDGTNYMEMKAVNECGEKFAIAWGKGYHNMSEFDMLMHLWNNNYNTHRFKNKELVRPYE